jgi:hypothetical protein
MDNLKKANQLIYFTNDELNSTIGFSIYTSMRPNMWIKERDDIITKATFITKNINKQFPDYTNVNKLVVKFSEYNSPCVCSSVSALYISIITLNTNIEHKATYKLHLYKYHGSKIGYTEIGFYYSYFL